MNSRSDSRSNVRPHEPSWKAVGFKHLENREGGGIANVVLRICRICGEEYRQVEISWPSGDLTVEPWHQDDEV